MNTKEGASTYRLPTEAEWEYAARAGTDTVRYWGDGDDEMFLYAWFDKNSSNNTHPVGQLKPNGFGLHDMLGNVWEWVQDWYSDKYYANSASTDPKGPSSGSYRVIRGGGWLYSPASVRSAGRDGIGPGGRIDFLGFRLARTCP
ncbi:MAG: formylglycine-generating enzyme family protein [Magnetococcus sp. YQC-3]